MSAAASKASISGPAVLGSVAITCRTRVLIVLLLPVASISRDSRPRSATNDGQVCPAGHEGSLTPVSEAAGGGGGIADPHHRIHVCGSGSRSSIPLRHP